MNPFSLAELKLECSNHIFLSELGFTIISILPNESEKEEITGIQPHSISRHSDGEVFTIGDKVRAGIKSPIHGRINSFIFFTDDLYIELDDSNDAYCLDSLIKLPKVPGKFQIGDIVKIKSEYHPKIQFSNATVTKAHVLSGRVQYDLQIELDKGNVTRLYNIEEELLEFNSPW